MILYDEFLSRQILPFNYLSFFKLQANIYLHAQQWFFQGILNHINCQLIA
ncbi:hypothetical protein J2W55_004514 [Mucilaginibacter pocheonensis]|uniref:Uncharacterized protein n=1 Tax=Mucilaginibacter pocheonensis TaxID=398050 RepID=A0ABU1TH71_9SPHI|nr:hypothetical protein [Mucilaginibacter pocheonensis]